MLLDTEDTVSGLLKVSVRLARRLNAVVKDFIKLHPEVSPLENGKLTCPALSVLESLHSYEGEVSDGLTTSIDGFKVFFREGYVLGSARTTDFSTRAISYGQQATTTLLAKDEEGNDVPFVGSVFCDEEAVTVMNLVAKLRFISSCGDLISKAIEDLKDKGFVCEERIHQVLIHSYVYLDDIKDYMKKKEK